MDTDTQLTMDLTMVLLITLDPMDLTTPNPMVLDLTTPDLSSLGPRNWDLAHSNPHALVFIYLLKNKY